VPSGWFGFLRRRHCPYRGCGGQQKKKKASRQNQINEPHREDGARVFKDRGMARMREGEWDADLSRLGIGGARPSVPLSRARCRCTPHAFCGQKGGATINAISAHTMTARFVLLFVCFFEKGAYLSKPSLRQWLCGRYQSRKAGPVLLGCDIPYQRTVV
jgi:hypothetical protein